MQEARELREDKRVFAIGRRSFRNGITHFPLCIVVSITTFQIDIASNTTKC